MEGAEERARRERRRQPRQTLAQAAVVPTLGFGVLEGRQAWERSVAGAAERARVAGRAYAGRIELYVRLHEQAVRAVASAAERSDEWNPEQLQRLVEAERAHFPGFVNVYAADARARAIAFSPRRGR
ncbi:MAG TPA: hypothetical protein VD741_07115, partial [Solirubrobacterales bacterium]|nr:hypothetical protein [Solirubrobacterales bacterium]